MNRIHVTDNEGYTNVYKVVSHYWTTAMTILVVAELILICFLIYMAFTNRAYIHSLGKQDEIQSKRNAAMDEMLLKRAESQIFSYTQACDYAKSKGESCLENPKWWANPENYPELQNQPSGTGLFPQREEE